MHFCSSLVGYQQLLGISAVGTICFPRIGSLSTLVENLQLHPWLEIMPSAQLTWTAVCDSGCSIHIEAARNYRALSSASMPMEASISRVALVKDATYLTPCTSADHTSAIRSSCYKCRHHILATQASNTLRVSTVRRNASFLYTLRRRLQHLLLYTHDHAKTSPASSVQYAQVVRTMLKIYGRIIPFCHGWWATYTLPGGQRWHMVSTIALPLFSFLFH